MIAQLVTCHLCSRGAALTGWSCLQGSIFSQNILVKKLSVRLSRGQLWGADFVFLAGVQLYQQWWEGPDGRGSRISAFITRILLYKPNSAWITLLSLIHWSEQQQQPGCDRLFEGYWEGNHLLCKWIRSSGQAVCWNLWRFSIYSAIYVPKHPVNQ